MSNMKSTMLALFQVDIIFEKYWLTGILPIIMLNRQLIKLIPDFRNHIAEAQSQTVYFGETEHVLKQ